MSDDERTQSPSEIRYSMTTRKKIGVLLAMFLPIVITLVIGIIYYDDIFVETNNGFNCKLDEEVVIGYPIIFNCKPNLAFSQYTIMLISDTKSIFFDNTIRKLEGYKIYTLQESEDREGFPLGVITVRIYGALYKEPYVVSEDYKIKLSEPAQQTSGSVTQK